MLPHCCKDDFIEFKNQKISFRQFKSRTLKAIGARNGREPKFCVLDDLKAEILPEFYDGSYNNVYLSEYMRNKQQ